MQNFYSKYFESLENKNFRLYFFAQFISLSGSSMQSVALAWLAYQITGSGTQLGIILGLTCLPLLLFGLFGGYIGQRYEHYKILRITQNLLGVVPLIVAVLIFVNKLNICVLYFAALWAGLITIIDQPASQSFMKTVVGNKNLKNAGSLFSSASSFARIAGPVFAGIIIQVFGAGICFLLNSLSFFYMSYAIHKMDKSTFFGNVNLVKEKYILESLKYVYQNRNIFMLLIIGIMMGAFMFEYQTLFLLNAKTVFQGNVSAYSFMISSFAIGGMFGGLHSAGKNNATFSNLRNIGVLLSVVYFLQVFVPYYLVFLVIVFAIGFFLIQFSIMSGTPLRLACDDKHMSIVMALWSMATVGMLSVGAILAGALSDHFVVKTVTVLYSTLFFISILITTQIAKKQKALIG